ncbi:aminoglycoside phosphotransferase family protein [Roseobacter ponti]|uniref:Phosphotransferase n=1 Tax=Roseobacter ponti TaxID=1891787 RepID=A0A858SLA9_9RHOB|nr:phosphotransferase [Roseobacter ponti]QJF49709.1 phosphotransferase [Roseobacter ponti]
MSERADHLTAFLQSHGWAGARITPLAGDASNRRYDRLMHQDGRHAVLMDAPPDKGEDVRPFVDLARFLRNRGLSAPEIFAADEARGFLLLEDLGDDLYARRIAADPDLEVPLYEAATDVLTALHQVPSPLAACYSSDVTTPLAALAFDWYQFGATGAVDTDARQAFTNAFARALAPLDAELDVLIQRDYHAENLLWLPQRTGAARVGLLDFQDAMTGHRAYDLVSVLQDARRDVTPATAAAMFDRYVTENRLEKEGFGRAYALTGAQRNLRILGVFARLCLRDSKQHYVDLIPRVWGHIDTNLRHPALAEIRPLIDGVLPEPDAAVLARLKSMCGTCRAR